jgi:Uma2 family endonuclease
MKILKLPRAATIQDLLDLDEKAEIVDGRVVVIERSGIVPARAAAKIWRSLDDYEALHPDGCAVPDGAVFVVDLPRRQSFAPDAAWYTGPGGMPFVIGAPVFVIEVRSHRDYGLRAEREMAAKRADYFAAGTLVVWDVDVLRTGVVRVYRPDDPEPVIFRRGEVADAEPAVPEWSFPVDALFG